MEAPFILKNHHNSQWYITRKLVKLMANWNSLHFLNEKNKAYLGHDSFTDIITFDYSEKDLISGDIFISIDRVKENASLFNTSLENEFSRVIIHGILHLLGYKDKSEKEKKIIRAKEDFYLSLQT